MLATPLRLVSLLSGMLTPFSQKLATYLEPHVPGTAFIPLPWEEGLRRLDAGEVEGAFLCGLLYVQRKRALEPLVAPVPRGSRYGGQPVYFADIVARAEFPTFESLRGARWAYNDPGSFSGYAAPLAHLAARSESLDFFGSLRPSGSHLGSLELLQSGKVDAAALDSTVFGEGKRAGLRVLRSLGPYPSPPLVLRRDLDATLKESLRTRLVTLHRSSAGAALLAQTPFSHFVAVPGDCYDVLQTLADRADDLKNRGTAPAVPTS